MTSRYLWFLLQIWNSFFIGKEKLFEYFIEKKEKQLSNKILNLIKNVEEDYKIKNSFSKLYDDINNLP